MTTTLHPAADVTSGRYAGGRLIDVLRGLARSGANGLVIIDPDAGDSEEAELLFIGGHIRAIRFGALAAAPALTRILVLPGGAWRIDPCSDPPAVNFTGDTLGILDQVAAVLRDCDLAATFGGGEVQELDATDLAAAIDDASVNGVNTATFTRTVAGATLEVGAGFRIPQPGDLLGRCRLTRAIGHGASSMVYLARHQSLDVEVVVKVLLPAAMHDGAGFSETAPAASAMTANEARILARLNHPNLMRVFDYDDACEHPYLVMEHVPGRSLHAMIREQGRIPAPRSIEIIRQVARGLAHAHARVGLVHNDLKPANILVTDEGQAKLADFALASMRGGGDRATTTVLRRPTAAKGPQVMGTPAYVAPECVRAGLGEPVGPPDQRSDIYALGATWYHALTGRQLFSHADPAKMLLMHVHDAWTPAGYLVPDLDPATGDLLARMLAKRPEDRPPTWGALVAHLESMGGRVGGRRTSFFKTLVGRVWHAA
jgi:tRNA A-37 threonylcarbamoyl transferase component Bud32